MSFYNPSVARSFQSPATGDLDMNSYTISNANYVICGTLTAGAAVNALNDLNVGGVAVFSAQADFSAGGLLSTGLDVGSTTAVIANTGGSPNVTMDFGLGTITATTTALALTGGTNGLKLGTSGTDLVGFYGATGHAQETSILMTNSITAGGTTDTVGNVVAASVDTSAASLVSTRNAMYQLARKLLEIQTIVGLHQGQFLTA